MNTKQMATIDELTTVRMYLLDDHALFREDCFASLPPTPHWKSSDKVALLQQHLAIYSAPRQIFSSSTTISAARPLRSS